MRVPFAIGCGCLFAACSAPSAEQVNDTETEDSNVLLDTDSGTVAVDTDLTDTDIVDTNLDTDMDTDVDTDVAWVDPCVDWSTGVCEIADVGLELIPVATPGANGLTVHPTTGDVYLVLNGADFWCSGQPDGDATYAETLSIIDGSTATEVANVPTDPGPVWPIVDVARDRVYVAASGAGGTIVAHDPATGSALETWNLGGRPHDMGLDVQGSTMVVSNTYDMSQTYVSVWDLDDEVELSHPAVPGLPHKIVVDDDERVAYVVSLGAGEITAIDLVTGQVVDTLSSGDIPQTSGMVFSPSRRILYVGKTAGTTPEEGNTLVAVDVDTGQIVGTTGTFLPNVSTPTRPWQMALDDETGLLYAALANSSSVIVVNVDTMTPVGLIEVDTCPWAVVLDVDRGYGYVSHNEAATVARFDLDKVTSALE